MRLLRTAPIVVLPLAADPPAPRSAAGVQKEVRSVARSLFVNRRGLHSVSRAISQLQGPNVDNVDVDVEVQVADGWVRGSIQARRSANGQWEALVNYTCGGGTAITGTGWFSSRRIRAIHEREQ